METLTVRHALDLVHRVLEEAESQSAAVAAVVVDLGGHVIASARGDGVSHVAADFARRKAAASAALGAPTGVLSEQFLQDPALAAAFTNTPELSLLPGGFPLVAGGRPIGALGVAGGHYSQDQAIGEKALQGS